MRVYINCALKDRCVAITVDAVVIFFFFWFQLMTKPVTKNEQKIKVNGEIGHMYLWVFIDVCLF